MNAKKISIGAKPSAKVAAAKQEAANNWVENRSQDEPMKRLTIDISASLHTAIKMQTAQRGTKIADEVRELLQEKYGSK